VKIVHIVGGDFMVEKMFSDRGFTAVEEPGGAELLCFTGGADVTPAYYGDVRHPTTRSNVQRDMRERELFEKYADLPKVGICRGSQFLNVMSGGTLWQDVDQHAIGHTHEMFYLKDRYYNFKKVMEPGWDYAQEAHHGKTHRINVTSTHHQMMRVDKEKAEVWGVAFLSRFRDRGADKHRGADYSFSPDIEIAWYPKTKSMCFQPHPEYGVKSCEDVFFQSLTRAFG
jgi:hypothetical protein